MGMMRESEAFSFVFWDIEKKRYFVYVPFQIGCKGRVKWNQPDLRTLYPADRYIEVISGHSHNTMHATFSSVDDKDENGEQLYMVLGNLDNKVPSFSIRACLMGRKIPNQPLSSIFDMTDEEFRNEVGEWRDIHPKEWETQIKPMDRTEQSTFTDKDGKQITLNFGQGNSRTKPIDFKDFQASRKGSDVRWISDKEARGRISRLMKGFLRDLVNPTSDLETELGLFLTGLLNLDSLDVQSALESFLDEWSFKTQYQDNLFPFGWGEEIPAQHSRFKEWPSLERIAEQEELDFFYNGKD